MQGSPHFRVASNGSSAGGNGSAQVAQAVAEEPKSARLFTRNPRTNSLLGVQIIGTGSYVPEVRITNAELEAQYGFEPGWIEQRSGILERRHAAPDQATSDLCIEAAQECLKNAGVSASEVDLVVVGTFTPDYKCPSTACIVQDRLGIKGPAFDIQAACSGFMYTMVTASQFVATGNAKMALVIAADINSRVVNPTDQRTSPLFGDAAGAVLITRGEPHQGLMCYQMGADGSGGPMLVIPSGGSRNPPLAADIDAGAHFLVMDGRNVFKWAVQAVTDTIELVLARSGMSVHEVSLFVLHQANIRIINYAMEQLGIPQSRVFNNLERYGNTSAASIPLALDELCRDDRIQRGDTILMCGFGAGLTWGTSLFRW